jgi:DnaJ family protein B protein 12
VNPVEVEDYGKSKWRKLDDVVEQKYIHNVNVRCEYESQQQQRMMQEAQGWFVQDQVRMDQARNLDMPNCRRLRELGLRY